MKEIQLSEEKYKDEEYMKRVLLLAEMGMGKTAPNPMVGAVIVKNGKIIGEGFHERCGQAHAEVNAINNATENMEGATVYVNLEPCSHYGKTPPCADLLIQKGVGRVVIGCLDPNPLVAGKGKEKLERAGIEVAVGVLEPECRKLNEVFLHYISSKSPFVILKAAISLDGKIATSSGESKWITEESARQDVHGLRSRYTAIMTGVETVIRDDPMLTCRLENGKNPIRIIVDSRLRIPMESNVLKDQSKNQTILATTEMAPPESVRRAESLDARVITCKNVNGRVSLTDLMDKLGTMNIDSILLEGGAALNDSAFAEGIIQKIILYVAPKIIGGAESKTFVGGLGISSLDQAYPLWIETMERIGEDLKITAYLKQTMCRQRGDRECLQELSKK